MDGDRDETCKGDVNPENDEKVTNPGEESKTEDEKNAAAEECPLPSSSDAGASKECEDLKTELSPIAKKADETSGATGGDAPQTPAKKSIFSKAKGIAVRGIQAVARNVSPKDSQGSSKESKSPGNKDKSSGGKAGTSVSPGDKEAKSSGKSPLKIWSKLKQPFTSGRKRRSEDEEFLPDGLEKCDESSMEDAAKETSANPGTEEAMDTGDSTETSAPAKVTAKEKRSRFAGLMNLKKGIFGDYHIEVNPSPQGCNSLDESYTLSSGAYDVVTFSEHSDATEELDMDTSSKVLSESEGAVASDPKENLEVVDDATTSGVSAEADEKHMQVEKESPGVEDENAGDDSPADD